MAMDIYLSVNNREEVMKIPVLPAEYTISKPQGLQTFETVSKGELQLIGTPKLKGITITSFFPIRDYPYLRDRSMKGQDYVYKIDTWILKKLPIRLIITDTPINMACAVKNFQYTTKTDGDLWYTLELEQFNLLGYENQDVDEGELTVTQYEELKQTADAQQVVIEELKNPPQYNDTENGMPEWAIEAVNAAKTKGILQGGDDGNLELSYSDLKVLTWLFRLGLLS